MALDRDTRREIQRDLALLGYDPRGIDGIFGPASRAAISAWQRDAGYPQTGYVTDDQINRLSQAAKVRAAELEAEGRPSRKAEEERRDTQYWRETGQGGTEEALRKYLARYPDGLFSEIAKAGWPRSRRTSATRHRPRNASLRTGCAPRMPLAATATICGATPTGCSPRKRRRGLTRCSEEAERADLVAAAKAEEERVANNGVTRLLVENRLQASGFDVGPG